MNGERAQYGPGRRGPGGLAAESGADGGASTGLAEAPVVDLRRPYRGESYYAQPTVRASHYGWLIAAYFFVGGVASAAQFIATIADLAGDRHDRGTVRAGRYLALAGALLSPALLIADLHTPRRWFNMLRIYRGTSAMSIGSWALSVFGAFSGLTAAGQFLSDLGLVWAGRLARITQLPAALAGGIVALYTGTLVAATNLPLASAAYPHLSSLFASSAASTAAAALALASGARGDPEARRRLNLVALAAGLSEAIFAWLIARHWRIQRITPPDGGIREADGGRGTRGAEGTAGAPPQSAQMSAMVERLSLESTAGIGYRVGVLGLGIAGPLVVHAVMALTGRHGRLLTGLAALSTLVGGFILRAVFIFGGNASALRPENYLRATEPRDGVF